MFCYFGQRFSLFSKEDALKFSCYFYFLYVEYQLIALPRDIYFHTSLTILILGRFEKLFFFISLSVFLDLYIVRKVCFSWAWRVEA